MLSLKSKTVIAIIVSLSLVPAAFSQGEQKQAQTQPTPAPASNYVDFSGFKGKVFDVKHRDPRALIEALRPLLSGFKGATIAYSDEFKTLSVRDFPENIAVVEEALK